MSEELKPNNKRPHCVLLGAGASLAAFPNGDKNGRKLPVMNNFIQTLELEPYFDKAGIEPPYNDFEAIYATISSQEKHKEIVSELEVKIYEYFAEMELPVEPTLYDHLLLSMRDKDVIATFNWDPFLFQAFCRNRNIAQLPKLFFLHGSVAIGICHKCKVKTDANAQCPKCKSKVENSKILYPVTQKNYNQDSFLKNEWDAFKFYLDKAYLFTIFGYGAPVSDVEAVDLLKAAWGTPEKRNLEEIEIIDLLNYEELGERWQDFIHTHHYRTTNNFYDSIASTYPRRTCEAIFECLMMCTPPNETTIPREMNFQELYDFLNIRISNENKS